MKPVAFDQSPPILPSSPPAFPPQQFSPVGQYAKCTSLNSLAPQQRYPAGGTDLEAVGSGHRKRQSVTNPLQALSASSASRAKSNARGKSRNGTQMLLHPRMHERSSLVLSRQVLLGVYVLPPLFDAVRRGRLSDFLSHLMQSTRREIHSLNAKGIAPRGRPGKPLERIEVDLSFLRSLDKHRRARVAAQRRFVINHVDMYRELSTILDEVMAKFRAVIEEIVGAEASDWSYFAYAAEVLPDTPSQDVHQDRGGVPRRKYFTCILPVTANAAPTEFAPQMETLSTGSIRILSCLTARCGIEARLLLNRLVESYRWSPVKHEKTRIMSQPCRFVGIESIMGKRLTSPYHHRRITPLRSLLRSDLPRD